MLDISFSPFPALQTQRLLLRRQTLADAAALFFLRSDERVMRYLDKPRAGSVAAVEELITRINTDIDSGKAIQWAIALQEEPDTMIGTICYWNLDKENYRAETGYVLHPSHWRKGYMKEALLKVIEYGFEEMKLHSIAAKLNPANTASAALLKAAGFVQEAYFREDYYFNGKFLDTAVYSRLR